MTLAARARGLETISQVRFHRFKLSRNSWWFYQYQEAPAKYQLILRKHLPIPDNEIVMLSISMGYPDLEKIKQFSASKQSKREVGEIIQFFGIWWYCNCYVMLASHVFRVCSLKPTVENHRSVVQKISSWSVGDFGMKAIDNYQYGIIMRTHQVTCHEGHDTTVREQLGNSNLTFTTAARVYHGLPETRGFSETGHAGRGMVCTLATPQCTAYPYRGVAGMHGLNILKLSFYL